MSKKQFFPLILFLFSSLFISQGETLIQECESDIYMIYIDGIYIYHIYDMIYDIYIYMI